MESRVGNGKYEILGKLGSGSFGEIYEVEQIQTNQRLAIKMEKNREDKPSRLMQEIRMYKLLQGLRTMLVEAAGVCRLHHHGTENDYNYLIIDRLASSLDDLFQLCQKKFSVLTVFRIAQQIISRLEYFHDIGYVHRDLKSDNFMIGYGQDSDTIFIIDFGLAKPYRDPKTQQHIFRKGGKSMVGTAKFASISSHDGFEQSRKDDLESLAFMLIYFARGSLPWQGIKSKVKVEKYAKIGELKRNTTAQKLCEGLPEQLLYFLNYVRSLEFSERPDYNYMRSIFQARLAKHPNVRFDWSQLVEDEPTTKN